MRETKRVHLICNAHIDPIWQWDWQEGVSAAISTFQSAVNLAEEFDYIFCHNEVTLYQYIEEYAPELFEKIKQLVKLGKWQIMGGWFLQPDCTMPCGESFVRQIRTGQRYFEEKFGVIPTTAINFDPFGHTKGLVQIIAKCGQNGYLFMRPKAGELPLASDQFWWEGYDGSRIKATRVTEYNSPLGQSVQKIKKDIDRQPQQVISSLWGVGNHGGGPSRRDLQEISLFIEQAAKENITVLHSTPERFLSEINPDEVFDRSLYSCMPGCYISMSRLKRLHIELENQLYFTEKLCSVAALMGLCDYPTERITAATQDLLNSEFHDVLPGSCIKSGEDNGIKLLHHGLLETEKIKTKAFFALLKEECPAKPGEYPVFVFNSQPYTLDTTVECEFMLADQNWSETECSHISVYNADGEQLPCQVIKEKSCINLDWRKRIAFSCKLSPLALNRFSVKVDFIPIPKKMEKRNFIYQDAVRYVEIDGETGLLKSFRLNGREYLHAAFEPVLFEDNADPWGMGSDQLEKLGRNPQPFRFTRHPDGVFEGARGIRVIEDGDIFLCIEAFFEKEHSKVRLEYKIYKNQPFVDVRVNVFWQDIDKLLRIAIPVNMKGSYIGQTAFGTDSLFMNGKENVSQRFVAVQDGEDCLAVFNNCIYGSMFENNTMYLSLLRGAGYCVHPIPGRPLVSDDRYVERMDQCEHEFSFRIAVSKRSELERMAQEFNQKPYALNAFPTVSGRIKSEKAVGISIENPDIVLIALKKADRRPGYLLRMFNNQGCTASTTVRAGDSEILLDFGKYEVKTLSWTNTLTECRQLEI